MRILLALLTLALAACQASERRLAFEPSPYRAELRDRGGELAARILLAAPAAVAELEDGRKGPFLQLLVRIENRGAAELTFDPARVAVVDDELAEFGPALGDVDGPARVATGETASFVLFLPYPEGVGMSGPRPRGLDVRLVIEREGTEIESGATLSRVVERRDAMYYGPMYGPMYGPWYDPWYPSYYWHRWQLTDHEYRD